MGTPSATSRARLLAHYQQQVQLVIDLLTTSAQQIPISEELSQRLHGYLAELHSGTQQIFGARFEFELYRRFMVCVHARLLRTAGETASDSDSLESALSALPAYCNAQEFLNDLNTLRRSLAAPRSASPPGPYRPPRQPGHGGPI